MIGIWTYRLIRWTLGGVFIYAGSLKLVSPVEFALMIDSFGLVPELLIMPVALLLPIVEVTAGIGLLFDVKGSLSIIAGLLTLLALRLKREMPGRRLLGRWLAWTATFLLVPLGIMVMISAHHFLTIYLGLELLSLSLYAMVAFDRDSPVAAEAAMKYFLLGAFSSAIFVFGIALLYGATGTTALPAMAPNRVPMPAPNRVASVSLPIAWPIRAPIPAPMAAPLWVL